MCTWLWQSFAVERLASCPRSFGSSLERPNARARKKFCQLCQSLKKDYIFYISQRPCQHAICGHFIFDRSSKITSYFQRYNIECKMLNFILFISLVGFINCLMVLRLRYYYFNAARLNPYRFNCNPSSFKTVLVLTPPPPLLLKRFKRK